MILIERISPGLLSGGPVLPDWKTLPAKDRILPSLPKHLNEIDPVAFHCGAGTPPKCYRKERCMFTLL
jgi:hypothetical protein